MSNKNIGTLIDEEVKKKTGLKTKEGVLAYEYFYRNANFDNKLIMYGNVTRDFCESISSIQKINSSMDEQARKNIEEKMMKNAERKYNFWLNRFIKNGSIKIKKYYMGKTYSLGHRSGEIFPCLQGYNPFNDLNFYIPYKRKDEKWWNGRVSKYHLTTEERERMEGLGYVFKN